METAVASRDETVQCPTCRAKQAWSDECRRCKSDLSLLRRFHEAAQRLRGQCLSSLRRQDFRRALDQARDYRALAKTDDAQRLVAVCHLLNGDWPAARGGN